ncbi:MAG: hypothetical protein HQK96_10345 [Nitrospirae bacterium]|nr:hypothetical protein [Nitrospirota bacterium]
MLITQGVVGLPEFLPKPAAPPLSTSSFPSFSLVPYFSLAFSYLIYITTTINVFLTGTGSCFVPSGGGEARANALEKANEKKCSRNFMFWIPAFAGMTDKTAHMNS